MTPPVSFERSLALALAMCVSLFCLRAGADEPAGPAAPVPKGDTSDFGAGKAMFDEAYALFDQGKWEEACPKFEVASKLYPSPGAQIRVADCHAHFGRIASAWSAYKLALTTTRYQADRLPQASVAALEKSAEDAIASLEPRLPYLRVIIDAPKPPPPGIVIVVRDQPISDAVTEVALPIDPGSGTVTVEAPGFEPSSKVVTFAEGERTELRFSLEAVALPPNPSPDVVPAPAPLAPSGRDTPPPDASVPTWVWVVGAAGLAMGGAAVGFLVDDLAAIDELRSRCDPAPNGGPNDYLCDAGYDADADNARKNLSGALALGFGAGAVIALTASVIGLATSGGDGDAEDAQWQLSPFAEPSTAGAMFTGSF